MLLVAMYNGAATMAKFGSSQKDKPYNLAIPLLSIYIQKSWKEGPKQLFIGQSL